MDHLMNKMSTPEHPFEYSYAWEKFYVATTTLVGTSSQRERLEYAFTGALMRLEEKHDLPEDVRDDLNYVREMLTSAKPVGDEGSVSASIAKLSDAQVGELAEKIVSMYEKIVRYDELARARGG